jgi:hypothetical protein
MATPSAAEAMAAQPMAQMMDMSSMPDDMSCCPDEKQSLPARRPARWQPSAWPSAFKASRSGSSRCFVSIVQSLWTLYDDQMRDPTPGSSPDRPPRT